MDHKKSEFPRLLRLYRKRCLDGKSDLISQKKVSEELGYALSTYGQWERGVRSPKARQDLLNVVGIFRRYGGIKSIESGFIKLAPAVLLPQKSKAPLCE